MTKGSSKKYPALKDFNLSVLLAVRNSALKYKDMDFVQAVDMELKRRANN